jgi:ABC-2 type transport system permease protein
MTTQGDTPAASASGSAESTSSIGPGLLWAALMFGVFAFWLAQRDLEGATIGVVALCILACAGFVLFAWSTFKSIRLGSDAQGLAAVQAQLRPILSLVALVAGVVVVGLAVMLAVNERMKAFAEASSLFVMGLICLGTGSSLRAKEGSSVRQNILQTLVNARARIAIVAMLLGVVCAGGGIYLAVKSWNEFALRFPGGPEAVGLVLVGLVFLAGGVYMQLTLDKPATQDGMRQVFLFLGSMTGFLVAFFTAIRVGLWWNEYFAGGIRTWQGEEGWRFWMCAYVAFGGLVLCFGSLLLALVDIRTHAIMRRTLFGFNAVLSGLLLIASLFVLNVAVTVLLPSNSEWSSQGLYSLSDKSISILEPLKERVKVYVLMARNMGTFLQVRDLLDNCQNKTSKLDVEYIAPDVDRAVFRELINTYSELKSQTTGMAGSRGARGILVVYGEGPETKKLPHTFIPEADLFATGMDRTGRPTAGGFKGEQVLMQAIVSLSENNQKIKLYFTQGSGELWLYDLDRMTEKQDPRWLADTGAAALSNRLTKENFEVYGLLWDAPMKIPGERKFVFAKKDLNSKNEVPADCDILVIANPYVAFPKDVLEAIDRYMGKGSGKLLVLAHLGILPGGKFANDGLGDLCKKYGVEVANDFTLRFGKDEFDIIQPVARPPANAQNAVARKMSKVSITMTFPRTVKPAKTGIGFTAETILEINEQNNNGAIWTEDTPLAARMVMENPLGYVRALRLSGSLEAKLATQPLPVGVAVRDAEDRPRAIVIGDYAFASSSYMESEPVEAGQAYDFLRSTMEWLADRKMPVIGISPREPGTYTLVPSEIESFPRMVLLPVGMLLLSLTGVGAAVWMVRRQ